MENRKRLINAQTRDNFETAWSSFKIGPVKVGDHHSGDREWKQLEWRW